MNNIRLAISPLTWSNDDMPSLGGDTSLETCLQQMKEAGFSGSEMGVKYPKTADALLPLLDKHQLSLASGWYSLHLCERSVEEEIEAIKPHLALLKACGCDVLVAAEVSNTVHGNIQSPLSYRISFNQDKRSAYGEKLTAVADFLNDNDVTLAFHHHTGTICESPEDIRLLIASTGPSVGLTLDTAHIVYGGGDPVCMIKEFADRIVHVHVKDVRKTVLADARNRDLPFLQAVLNGVFTVPGDGDLPFQDICHALKSIDYSGWIVVEAEQDPVIADPKTYANMAYKNMVHFLQKADMVI